MRTRRVLVTARSVLLVSVLLPLMAAGCSHDPATAIAEGDALAAKGQYAQAIAAYRAGVKRSPNDGHLRLKLAKACMADQRWDDALEESLRAADLLPGDFEAEMLAASRSVGSWHFLEGLIRASKLREEYPNDANVTVLAGNATARLLNESWALYRLPDTVKSTEDFDRARLEIRPEMAYTEDEKAELLFREALAQAPAQLDTQLGLVNFLWAAGRPEEGEELLKQIADANPGHAVVNYALGSYYVWHHRPAEAEPYLKNATAAGQYGVGARLVLADIYAGAGRDREALDLITSLQAANDAAGEVSLRAAPIEFRLGKHDAAIRRIDAFLAREPRNARALTIKAQFLVAGGQFDQALKLARDAVSLAPEAVEARTVLGQALFGMKDFERAFAEDVEAVRVGPSAAAPRLELTRVALALGRYKEALQFAHDAVRSLPDNPDAVVMLARAMVRSGDTAGAERELMKGLERFGDRSALLIEIGTVRTSQGNATEARAAFSQALQMEGRSVDALAGLISLDLKARDAAAARRRIEAASPASADDLSFLLLAARVYAADNDATRGESTLRHALAVDPVNSEAALALSDLLASQKRYDEARAPLAQLSARTPGVVEIETALATLLERAGKITEARKQYEKIVSDHPRAGAASYRLAAIYLDNGGDLEAAASLANAAKGLLTDDDGAIRSLLARIYVKQGFPGNAVPNLEDAIHTAPNNAAYRYQLGFAYLKVRDFKGARTQLTRALQLDGTLAQAAEARETLASLP